MFLDAAFKDVAKNLGGVALGLATFAVGGLDGMTLIVKCTESHTAAWLISFLSSKYEDGKFTLGEFTRIEIDDGRVHYVLTPGEVLS